MVFVQLEMVRFAHSFPTHPQPHTHRQNLKAPTTKATQMATVDLEWWDARASDLFEPFTLSGDTYNAKCKIPGICPDGGVCSMKVPANGGEPNFPQARKRHMQKHKSARNGKTHQCEAASTPLVTPEVAPPGGSLTQDQVDSLVAHGVRKVITDLASLPKAMCDDFYHALLEASPEARKLLVPKIARLCVDHLFKKTAGGDKKAIADRIASEKEQDEIREEEDRNCRLRAEPWRDLFTQPIPAEDWTAVLLHLFIEHGYGFRLLIGIDDEGEPSEESLAETCQLPTLVKLLQGYWSGSTLEGYLGEFEHPSGRTIELAFHSKHWTYLSYGLPYSNRKSLVVAKNKHSLPRMEVTEPGDMPWDAEPTVGRPATFVLVERPPAIPFLLRRRPSEHSVSSALAVPSLAPPQKMQKCDAGNAEEGDAYAPSLRAAVHGAPLETER